VPCAECCPTRDVGHGVEIDAGSFAGVSSQRCTVAISPGSPVVNAWNAKDCPHPLRGPHDPGHVVSSCRQRYLVARAMAMTLTTSRPAAGVVPPSSGAGRRVQRPIPTAQPRMPPERDTAVVSAAGVVDDMSDPDALLARLSRLAPGDTRRVAMRAEVIEWFCRWPSVSRVGSAGVVDR
jgi:hypothetical protein